MLPQGAAIKLSNYAAISLDTYTFMNKLNIDPLVAEYRKRNIQN